MKKLLLTMVLVMTMICLGGVAGAESLYFCNECLEYKVSIFTNCGDHHSAECTGCGTVTIMDHYIDCTDLTKCAECGATTQLENGYVAHEPDIFKYLDETYHQMRCACGKNVEKVRHYGIWIITKYNEKYHQVTCLCSDDVNKLEAHTAYCRKDATVCSECGDTGVTTEVKHNLGDPVWKDEYTHVQKCEDCDYVSAPEEHWVYCWHEKCLGCWSENVANTPQHTFVDGVCSCGAKENEEATKVPGDADGNSSVTLADVRAILSGKVSSEANADVTGDGKADQQDVLRIMQYIAGWNVTLQ